MVKPAASERPRRPRRARDSLSRDVIIQAAKTVAVRSGLEGLTFQALGEELDAHPTSIYRHFRDKDELVLELIDALRNESYGGKHVPTDDWRSDLKSLSDSIHQHYLRYPEFAQQMAARTTRRPTEFANVELALDALLRAGLPPTEAVLYLRVFGNFVRSLSSIEAAVTALPATLRRADEMAWRTSYAEVDPEQYPRIAQVAEHLHGIGDPTVYEEGIELLLDAIEQRARQLSSQD
ncbi:TetR/AcrR family transcriptional regulator [Actinoplanes bogorensis]|uniref:TetR/AcrR family transcriptional regulator n=1 Tax=Paractinoplanes bogorensis TaxID=1610840 RepID=A0ABS5YZL8_9ACTN|nr:TetR/AcrR family transcriptional regulator [Actinoplanes bogorensis]MBU2668148.1 TetR/AcrR family transcriptional regulator [Actinoplanes bogorensis]